MSAETAVLGIKPGFKYTTEASRYTREQAYYLGRSLGISPDEAAKRPAVLSQAATAGRVSRAFRDLGEVGEVREALNGLAAMPVYVKQEFSFGQLLEIGQRSSVELRVTSLIQDKGVVSAQAYCRLENGDVVAWGEGAVLLARPGDKYRDQSNGNGSKANGTDGGFEVTSERVFHFAVASGDFSPVHVDQEAAEAGFFGQPVAHGAYTLSVGFLELARRVNVSCVRASASFKQPVFVYDRLKAPLDLQEEPARQRIVPYSVVKQGDETVVRGEFVTAV